MAETMHLTVVTPEKVIYDDQAEAAIVQGSEGELGIFFDHAPLATALGIGVLNIKTGKDYQPISISGGFLEVLPQQVTVLADAGERPEEIDLERAQEAKKRAEDRLTRAETDPEVDFARAKAALQRAISRIRIAGGED